MKTMKTSNNLTLGILAHVDAGKTTLSEGILYETGITRSLGRVDHGDAFLDNFELEKKRGITIFSKQAVFQLGDKKVTLLDTPGHIDFSAEMERTLAVLDYALLVISCNEGVTGHVETLWKLLKSYEIPTFIFVNKMDQSGADISRAMEILHSKLGDGCLLFDGFNADDEEFLEKAALCDENALEGFLDTGKLPMETILRMISERKIFPCFSGSALKMQGITELLDGISTLTEASSYEEEFGAKVFKISRDSQGNRLTHLKITGGSLSVKQVIGEEKVNQIRIYNGRKFEAVDSAGAGSVVCVTGLNSTYIGQGLGICENESQPVIDSVISYKLIIPQEIDVHKALMDLNQLAEEIPELHVLWKEENQEISINLMGEIQAEIIKSMIKERFDFDVEYSQGAVLYKETIAEPTYGIGHYEPLKHYAEVHLYMEPLPPGSGLIFDSICSEDILDKNWQRLIATHLAEREHPGVLTGAEITDMKISIATGKAHNKHTEGGDFRQATYRATRNGLRKTQCILLEPYYDFVLELPAEIVGRGMSDIQAMSGSCNAPEALGETAILTGDCPVATMNGYQRDVISYSKGRGRLTCLFKGYFPCHNQKEIVAETAYNPDTDADNPTGSVFCSHGSGTYIPWNEVIDYAHMSVDKKFTPVVHDDPKRPRRTEYSDAELEAVFQRTFGANKRENNRFRRSPRVIKASEATFSGPKVQSGYNKSDSEEILIVDGYNIIFAWDELKEMSKLNLESARNLLIDMLRNYHGYCGDKIIIVFDAYRQPRGIGFTEKFEGISVVYTKENETADQYIEKYVLENGKKQKITVATSDGLEQIMIFGQGALRMPARELKQRVEQVNEEIREKYLK